MNVKDYSRKTLFKSPDDKRSIVYSRRALGFGSPLISYDIAMGKKEKDCEFLSIKFWSKL